MKCKDCLIWQNKLQNLKAIDSTLLSKLARYLRKKEIPNVAPMAYKWIIDIKGSLREHILLGDETCQGKVCILYGIK